MQPGSSTLTTAAATTDLEAQAPSDDKYLSEDPNRLALVMGVYIKKPIPIFVLFILGAAIVTNGVLVTMAAQTAATNLQTRLSGISNIAGGALCLIFTWIIYNSPYDTFKALQETITALKTNILALNQTVQTFRDEIVPKLTTSIQGITTERDALHLETETLKLTNNAIKDNVSSLTVTNTELQGNVSALSTTNKDLQGNVSTLTAANAELDSKLKKLSSLITNVRQVTTDLFNQISGKNEELTVFFDGVKKDIADSFDEQRAQHSHFFQAVTHISEVTSKLDGVTSKLDGVTLINEQLITENKGLVTKLSNLAEQLLKVVQSLQDQSSQMSSNSLSLFWMRKRMASKAYANC